MSKIRKCAKINFMFCLLIAASSCQPRHASHPQSRADLNAALKNVIGVEIPSGATRVNGRIMTMMTHTVDVEFECNRSEFIVFWDSSPRLSKSKSAVDVDLDPATSKPDFDSSWRDARGMQFCSVSATATHDGTVKISINSTHEK